MSSSGSVFGPARWVRGLIKPAPGRALVYLDYEAQEFGVSAYLSGDPNMIAAYESGDPYLAFAKMAKMAPEGATKTTHGEIRDVFKVLCLAVSYGMGTETFARTIKKSEQAAEELLRIYRRTFSVFCEWRERALNFAITHGYLHTMFDWRLRFRRKDNIRTFYNFLSQGGAAEMLRVAAYWSLSPP
jgi:DNA polymerase I-like protein with 3'-5' exonuclease and polymerase domains